MAKVTAPRWASNLYRLSGYLTEDFGGGHKTLKMAWVINLHKIITLFIILGMMVLWSGPNPTAGIEGNR